MSSKKFPIIGVLAVFAIVGAFLLISGSDDSGDKTGDVDAAFAADMVPHHEGAIEMAQIARRKAEKAEIVSLAEEIIAGQSAEIETLGSIHERLTGKPVGAGGDAMGMSDSMMGMDMDMSALEEARPFDREFIDQMIPHHQGAIHMAYMVLDEGDDQETIDLADAVIAAQSKEIDRMNRWRRQWYGAESPAGGVPERPAEGESMDQGDSMEGMHH